MTTHEIDLPGLEKMSREDLIQLIINLEKEQQKKVLQPLSFRDSQTKYYSELDAEGYFEKLSEEYGRAIEVMDISSKSKIYGRDQEIKELTYSLNQKETPVAMLLANAGVGKTSLLKGWKLKQDEIGDYHFQVVALNMMQLQNGGDIADRVQRLIPDLATYERKLQETDEQARVVLFIDEAHTLISAFDTTGVKTKLGGDLLKTILTNCPIRVVAATTYEEYFDYFSADKALARRFDNLDVPELSKEVTRLVMRNWMITYGGNKYEDKRLVTDQTLDLIIETNRGYRSDLAEPAKSLAILRKAFSIHETDNIPLDKEVVEKAFARKNIKIEQDADFKKVMEVLNKKIKGQPLAMLMIKIAVLNMVYPTSTSDRPRLAMLLVGTTGVGKTATAKAIALATGTKFEFFDMSTYAGEKGKERFINRLGRIAEKNPDATILFDELEKAQENQILFLQILDEGRITYFKKPKDGGEDIEVPVSLKGFKIIATTNAGHKMFDSISRYSPERNESVDEEDLRNSWQRDRVDLDAAVIGDGFRPEVYNRFRHVIPYYPLSMSVKVEIARMMLEEKISIFNSDLGVEIKLPEPKRWGSSYKHIGEADAVSMYIGVELQGGKGTSNGGARDLEKGIEDYFDVAIKEEMVKPENATIKTYKVQTNGNCNFEQNARYEEQRAKRDFLSNYQDKVEFSNGEGALQVIKQNY